MELKKKYQPAAGLTDIVSFGEGGLKKSTFSLLSLVAGESFTGHTSDFESAFVILTGTCNFSGEEFNYQQIGARKTVFTGKPTAVYVSINVAYQIKAVTAVEIAICSAKSDRKNPTVLIKPEDVTEVQLGVDNWKRKAYFMIDQQVQAQYLFLGETHLSPGKWAFPPHRHDFDRLPEEVDMEEVYHFRVQPQAGFGIQLSYTDDLSREEAYMLRNGDTVIIPNGYHPVAASPVDSLYMLWFMAGENRMFLAKPEDNYRWVAQYENYGKAKLI